MEQKGWTRWHLTNVGTDDQCWMRFYNSDTTTLEGDSQVIHERGGHYKIAENIEGEDVMHFKMHLDSIEDAKEICERFTADDGMSHGEEIDNLLASAYIRCKRLVASDSTRVREFEFDLEEIMSHYEVGKTTLDDHFAVFNEFERVVSYVPAQ